MNPMRNIFLFLLLAGLSMVLMALEALAEKRVALVIGNSAYGEISQLANPTKDAGAIAVTLKRLGFAVTLKLDLEQSELRRSLGRFARTAAGADIALIYYAGHGIEVGGQNYLIPTDAQLTHAVDVDFEAVTLTTAMGALEGAGKLKLIILDACRNNPFAARMARTNTARSIGRGLARVEPRSSDTLVAYAAKGGTTADDGKGAHSPYTAALLRHLETPGLEIRLLFGKVRDSVMASTGQRQEPFTYGSLGGSAIYLVPENSDTDNGGQTVGKSRDELALLAYNGAKGDAWKLGDVSRRYEGTVYGGWARRDLEVLVENRSKERGETKVAVGLHPDKLRWLKAGSEFRDCSDCPEMVVVPAGSFMMGSLESEKKRDENEGPQHRVTISQPFAVGKFEVTFAEWDDCVAAGGCKGHRPDDKNWGRGRRPVIEVSWNDAKSYVKWLFRKTGKEYRLLSESEWEYTARAGTVTPFSTGERIATDQANFNGNHTYNGSQEGRYRERTIPVGSFSPNSFGLHDMHGNVWEWVEDCYHDSYKGAPEDGPAWTAGNCSNRVLRGGSWYNNPKYIRFANRYGNLSDFRYYTLGFRVARSMPLARTLKP